MWLKKCDTCKKELKEQQKAVRIGYGYDVKDYCINCGKKLLSKLGQKEIIIHG